MRLIAKPDVDGTLWRREVTCPCCAWVQEAGRDDVQVAREGALVATGFFVVCMNERCASTIAVQPTEPVKAFARARAGGGA